REVERQTELLFHGLRQIGEDKLGLLRGHGPKQALFAFPLEFHALKDGVVHLVELLHEEDPYHARPLLRGFYFTSALQTGEPCIAADARVSSHFGLIRNNSGSRPPQSSHGYFLRDLFREVLFPDQYLIMRQTRPRATRLRFAGMLTGLAALMAAGTLLTQTWLTQRDMLANIGTASAQARALIASGTLYDKLKALTLLQKRLQELPHLHDNGVPLWHDMGLYQGKKLEVDLRSQYFGGLRAVMMTPLQARLETVLGEHSQAAGTPPVLSEPPVQAQSGAPASGPRRAPNRAQTPPRVAAPQPRLAVAQTPPEDGYDALKTYLMLGERARLEADWLSEQMPRYWHAWLEANRGENNIEEIETEARQVVAFYVSQLKAPDLPLIGTDPLVIENVRLALRSAKAQRPKANEIVYNEIKARANARFPVMTVTRILEGKDAGIVTGTATIEGIFTRDAYEKYVRQAIDEASRGEIKGDDWVLATGAVHETPDKNADVDKKRAELEAIYREDYGDAWLEFLQGLTIVANPGDVAQAERLLERLADPHSSPLKIVLQRIAYETAWDNPPPLSTTVDGARQAVITRANNLIGSRAATQIPVPRQDSHYGELGQQFAPLAAVVADNGKTGAAPLMAGYQGHLANLKGQFNLIAASDDQATASRKLIQATLDGSGSEFVETLQYIDNTLLAAVEDQDFKDILRPLLASPLTKSYATLLPPVEQELDDVWGEVYEQWQTLSEKYPFSNARSEASLGEITRFIKPGGTLEKFVGEHMNGLVTKRGGQFVPRFWSELGVRVNPSFLTGVERLFTLGRALSRDGGESSRFELRPTPTPGLSEITLEIDGQSLRYRNGPQPWQTFNWPGDDAHAQGARIQVVAFDGTASTVSSQTGRMGLMRMIGESTRIYDQNMSTGQMTWRFNGPKGANSVKFDFRMMSGLNLLQLTALSRIDLPRRITQ
ncbi:MAG: hypothetical protein LBU45_06680, partial [Azoarcus sp.]|nr:hypothetical protein [Azoarcus sp.]